MQLQPHTWASFFFLHFFIYSFLLLLLLLLLIKKISFIYFSFHFRTSKFVNIPQTPLPKERERDGGRGLILETKTHQ